MRVQNAKNSVTKWWQRFLPLFILPRLWWNPKIVQQLKWILYNLGFSDEMFIYLYVNIEDTCKSGCQPKRQPVPFTKKKEKIMKYEPPCTMHNWQRCDTVLKIIWQVYIWAFPLMWENYLG
jgi:hypothetical protein